MIGLVLVPRALRDFDYDLDLHGTLVALRPTARRPPGLRRPGRHLFALSTPPSFTTLTRAEWGALAAVPEPSGAGREGHELIPPDEVATIYAPFSHLLRGNMQQGVTYLIGIAGAVSVGKSTTAKLLQDLLAADLDVGLISTDGFLLPNTELELRPEKDARRATTSLAWSASW
jgi:hypothetical protein